MGEVQTPMPPPPGGAGSPPRSTQVTTALVLGILSLVCCALLGPVAWYMGREELKKIAAGEVAREDEGTAKIAMILGIIGTVFLALGILWVIFFGGLSILGAIVGNA